jgi:hypothetical protein
LLSLSEVVVGLYPQTIKARLTTCFPKISFPIHVSRVLYRDNCLVFDLAT